MEQEEEGSLPFSPRVTIHHTVLTVGQCGHAKINQSAAVSCLWDCRISPEDDERLETMLFSAGVAGLCASLYEVPFTASRVTASAVPWRLVRSK